MRDVNEVIFSPTVPSGMDKANGSFSFKDGECSFGWERTENGVKAFIDVPRAVYGKFIYKDRDIPLQTGYNEFEL